MKSGQLPAGVDQASAALRLGEGQRRCGEEGGDAAHDVVAEVSVLVLRVEVAEMSVLSVLLCVGGAVVGGVVVQPPPRSAPAILRQSSRRPWPAEQNAPTLCVELQSSGIAAFLPAVLPLQSSAELVQRPHLPRFVESRRAERQPTAGLRLAFGRTPAGKNPSGGIPAVALFA